MTKEYATELPSDESYIRVRESSGWAKFKDGFTRQTANEISVGKQLEKGIANRHLKLMALSTGIGAGLLVASGGVLNKAGPLFVIVGYAIVGSFVYPTLQAAGEMAVNYSDLSGGYNNYPRKFVDEAAAFAITWNYCIQLMADTAIQLVTASMTIRFWNTSINPDVWVTIFYIVILLINFKGAKGYGEGEFILGSCKLLLLVGFIFMSIIVTVGGGPEKEYIGGRYWHDPGFYTDFKGLCSVFVTGAFSLGQSEFVALSAAEQTNPRQAIPNACKLIFWRILVLFLGSLTLVGLLVPYNSPRLLGGGGSEASPYVLAAELHGVSVVPGIVNAVILLSVTSVASSSLYSASRTLQSLSEQRFAPAYFNYIDNQGRPLRALIFCSVAALFSFIAAFDKQEEVFYWLLTVLGLSQIFTWFGICISHVRFRMALKYNNISTDSLGYVSQTGVWGSYYAMACHILVLVAQFWISLFPVGKSKADVTSFFQGYLGVIILLLFYFGYKIWHKDWKFYIKIEDIDIYADRTMFDEEKLKLEREEQAEKFRSMPVLQKVLKVLFY